MALARQAAKAASGPLPHTDPNPDPFGLLSEYESTSAAFSVGQRLPAVESHPGKGR